MSAFLIDDFGLQAEIHRGFVRFFTKRGLPVPIVRPVIEDERGFRAWARRFIIHRKSWHRQETAQSVSVGGRRPASITPKHLGALSYE